MRKVAADVCSVEKRCFNRKLLADCWDEFCSLYEGCPDLIEMQQDLISLDGPARSDKDYLSKNSIQTFVNFYSTNPRQRDNTDHQGLLAFAPINHLEQQSAPLRRQPQPALINDCYKDEHYQLQPQPISTTDQSMFDTDRLSLNDCFDRHIVAEASPAHLSHQDPHSTPTKDARFDSTSYHLHFDSSPQTSRSTLRNHSPYKSLFPTDPRALAKLRERSSTPVKKTPQPSSLKPLQSASTTHLLVEDSSVTRTQQSPTNSSTANKKIKFVSRVELHHQTMRMKDKENSFVEKVPLTFQSSGREAEASSRSNMGYFRGY